MKLTEFILDELYPATDQLEKLLNDGYEIVSSQFFNPSEDRVFYAAVLVKEEDI